MQDESTDHDAFIAEEPRGDNVGSDAGQKHGKSKSKSTTRKNESFKKLERHTLSLWLASAFAIVSIFTWAITCTLSYKPVRFETYHDSIGRFSKGQFEENDRWRRVSRVGLQVLGTLSIPLTSAVCARAVVVYCQRSSTKRQPTISMRQTLVLADKGWLDLDTWVNLFGPTGGRYYSPPLVLSMLLCGLGIATPSLKIEDSSDLSSAFSISILQGAFIDTVSITVMTNADTNDYNYTNKNPVPYSTVGTTLSAINGDKDLYLPSVVEATIAGKAGDLQPNLWVIGQNRSNLTSLDSFYSSPGVHFDPKPEGYNIPLPAAKNWTRDNGSSHSITEELYIDLQTWVTAATSKSWGTASDIPIRYNFTFHCVADSNLAYFEPMNEWKGHQVQDKVDINAKYNPHFTGPNTPLNPHELIYSPAAPGPLATSVRALFGNNTFFNSIINANDTRGANLDVCRALRIPLTGLCSTRGSDNLMCNPFKSQSGSTLPCIRPDALSTPGETEDQWPSDYGLSNATASDGTLAYFLYMWLQRFNNWNSTMAALTLTNFYSARALLDPSRARTWSTFENTTVGESGNPIALPIFSSPGFRSQKLHTPFAAIVVISTLIFLQITGLLALGIYTSIQRTWTASLNGFALLRIGKSMGDELPLISAAEKKEADILDRTEGWIGDEDDGGEAGGRLLQIGGSGRLMPKRRYRTKREPET
ncbi:uncharacterized protein KY384_000390 [Bacidia gigantensis]|uniref:uncharacterized protein n=1 Tax=Bacidia gigantensis TaxID=2732470 RepID=UPI001D04D202|nr:uncharacterized protein KY384_000390 [Bacidia gigantensis]KAG8526396.1 hypothetical protein KY384_000390 [Bacidia gigantensis]